ncbi:MAG: hypothetical protein RL404_1774 [Pseudomonadota bacterium]|jgi:hypothetical protein
MNAQTPNMPEGAPNCWQCRHFAVSWDPKLPYQCKLMGFKSRIAPSLEVLRADGSPCRGFLQKSLPPGVPTEVARPARTFA